MVYKEVREGALALVFSDVSRSYELARGPRYDRGIVAVLSFHLINLAQLPECITICLLAMQSWARCCRPPVRDAPSNALNDHAYLG